MARKKMHYAWIVLVACCGMTSGMGIILMSGGQWFVAVTGDLGISTTEIALYFTICSLGMAVGAPFVGKLLPKMNVRVLLTGCYLLVVAALFAMAFYNAPWQWWLSGAVFGLAGCFVFIIPTPIILGNWFAKKTGFVVGIALSFSGIAAAIANPVAAALIANMGWRFAYMAMAVITAVIVLPCTALLIRFKPEDKGLLPYGAEEAVETESSDAPAPSAAMTSGVPAKRAYRSVSFWLLFLVLGALSMLGGFSQLLPMYMDVLGMTAIVGVISTMAMAGQFVGTLGLGAISDRFGGTVTAVLGAAVVTVGFLLLIFFGQMTAAALGGGAFYGVALSLGSVVPALICREAFGDKDFASLYSTLMIAVSGLGAVGNVIITLILDLSGSFYPAFWLGVSLCVGAIVVVVIAMKLAKRLPREA